MSAARSPQPLSSQPYGFNDQDIEAAGDRPGVRIIGSTQVVENQLNAVKDAARYDLKIAALTEIGLPIAGYLLESAIWYFAEHIKHNRNHANGYYDVDVLPVDNDWGQTILNFGLPVAIASLAVALMEKNRNATILGLAGTAAAAGAGAAFKALGLNGSLPSDNACRSAIHGLLGMASSSMVKAGTYLGLTRLSTFAKRVENIDLQKNLIDDQNNGLTESRYQPYS